MEEIEVPIEQVQENIHHHATHGGHHTEDKDNFTSWFNTIFWN